jgi:pimeloyl-ACP methyl ester carboxylesterase
MRKNVERFFTVCKVVSVSASVTLGLTALVALWHKVETPQPLESILPGEAHIYRWRPGHVYYKTLGEASMPPLVLVHAPAIGASAYEMRKIASALAQHYHVYAPDLPGFGLSDRPGIDYSAETYAAFLRDFLTDVVGQPALILASGLSCNYAVSVASEHPELCSRLVLIAPFALFGGSFETGPLTNAAQVPVVSWLLYPLLSTKPVLRYVLARQHVPEHDPVPSSDVDHLYAAAHQFGAEYAPMALLSGRLTSDTAHQFDSLQQPMLVIWGAKALDDAPSLARQHLSARANIETMLIRGANEYVHEEFPAMVITNILNWSSAGQHRHEHHLSVLPERITTAEPSSQQTNSTQALELEQEHQAKIVVEAYCVKCKRKTIMLNPQEGVAKNGRAVVKGTCSVCGTHQNRMGRL